MMCFYALTADDNETAMLAMKVINILGLLIIKVGTMEEIKRVMNCVNEW